MTMLTTKQAADRLGFSVDHICRLARIGHLAFSETEGRKMFSADVVASFRPRPPGPTPKTHCKRGHELTPDNVRHQADRGRSCLACGRASSAAFRLRRRAAR